MIRRDATVQQTQNSRKRSAFTLIELVVVIAIIVALAGMGGWFIFGEYETSKMNTARIQAGVLKSAILSYNVRNGFFPNTMEDLVTGNPPLLENRNVLTNPFGHPYQFNIDEATGKITVSSDCGAHGIVDQDGPLNKRQ